MSSKAIRGGMYCEDSSATVRNCVFADNTADFGGAALLINMSDEKLTSVFSNCVFSKNEGKTGGGGIFFYPSDPGFAEVTNCTFYGNDANYAAGGICNIEWNVTATNCIFWGNTAIICSQIDTYSQWATTISYCDIEDSYTDVDYVREYGTGTILGTNAGGNIDDDPDFDDTDDLDGDDNDWATADDGLMLKVQSPCRNAADEYAAPLMDITGKIRAAVSTYPDMGAYESKQVIVVMCWINESSNYHEQSPDAYYNGDLDGYNDLIETLDVVKSGCYVPPYPIDGEDPGDPAKVLPIGYPEPVTMDDFPGRNDAVLSNFTDCFNGLTENGSIVPDYVLLIVDNSDSMKTSDIEPHYSQATEDNFIHWIRTNYNTVIRTRDDPPWPVGENPFDNERWLEAMRLQIESALEEL